LKKIDLGQTISIFANVGVIAGIIFLAVELRQNTAAVQGSTYQALSDGSSNQYIGVVHDTSFAEILIRVYQGAAMEDFSDIENGRLIFYYNAMIQRLENSYYQWQTGLVDDRILQSYGWTDGVLTSKHFSEYWSLIGATRNTSPGFREFFEEHVVVWTEDQTE